MKRDALSPNAVARARSLRREATTAEAMLWQALRERLPDAKFRRQVPLGPYFADFASHRAKLIVEVDGSQHAERIEQDAARTQFLESEGFAVIRFWNSDVLGNMNGVLERIGTHLSPRGRGRAVGPGEGPAASAAEKTRPPAGGRSGIEPSRPLPSSRPSPTRGEGVVVNSDELES